jgi:hypothetical protein
VSFRTGPMANRLTSPGRGARRSLLLLASVALAACSSGGVTYSDEERVELMLSNLEERFGGAFWHQYLEDVSVDGTEAVAVTSNVLVSSRICFGVAESAVDGEGRRIGVDSIEIHDTLGNSTFDCDVDG